jgi:8-oxo-dGTP pyrophosphatase MutT (NUDIX family)
MKIITFDFDNTIAMSYMDTRGDSPNPVFQGYNNKIIDKIRENIEIGNEVYLVTSRKESLESYFPKQSIPYHLKQLGLDEYFLPDRLFYTNGESKYPILLKLGTELHYDDDIKEHKDAWDSDYRVKQPLEDFPDSPVVGKAAIFDDSNNILVLQRSDSGHFWDLPGGHIKEIEAKRGPDGIKEGTEREIYEETGLLVPFLKELVVYDFRYKGKLYHLNVFVSQISTKQPHVRLDLEDHVENIDYKWVSLTDLEGFLDKSTANLRKAHAELSIMDTIFEQDEPFQRAMKKKHRKMKKRLVGLGKNKHFGGGKGHTRPKMSRSKSAPPGFGIMEEEKWPKE